MEQPLQSGSPGADDPFVARLGREIDAWRQEQVITEEQAAALLARYGGAAGRPRKNLAIALAFIGAALIGAGVVAFFASNWSFIPGWAKLALIAAAVIAAQAAGYRLRYETTTFHGTGNALLFLGTVLYGAAIFLIAQGFHVNAGEPSLLLLWAAGALPMAYLLRSRAIVALSVLVLGVALVWESSFWFWEADYVSDASRVIGPAATFLLFGCLVYALGCLHAARQTTEVFRQPYGVLGLLGILGALLPLTSEFSHDGWHSRSAIAELPPAAVLRLAALGTVCLVAVVAVLWIGLRDRLARAEAAGLLALVATASGLFVYHGGAPLAMTVAMNALMLATVAGVMALGFWRREPAWINAAAVFLTIQVACRYCDIFWRLMPPEAFFTGAGIALLAGGVLLERTRRQVVRHLQEGVA